MARLTWTAEMETDLALLLRADPSTPNQQIRNAAAVLGEKYGIEFTFTAVQAKRWYLIERGVVAEIPGSAADIEPPTLPLYNQAFRLPPMRGWLAIGDLHAPYTQWTLLAESISRALDMGVTAAVIVGDLYDAQAYSTFPSVVPPPSFDAETRAAEYALEMLLRYFKRVVITTGNHDARILKQLGGALPSVKAGTMLLDLIGGPRDGRVLWSVYGYCTLDSPTGPWRLTHQRNYSRIRGRVAVQLAAKYGMHVITYHEHGLGKLPSDCGRFTCIACGCMADYHKMAYMQLVDTTAPVWQTGYVIIDRHGVGTLHGGPPGFAARYVLDV